ncbi:MAG: hypothetical protein A3H70_03195 [Candidatus Komeilibacteria bacterium RIFCSPLOWO2_02_FULL_48_11]|uniref:Uncharacterized protein n=1 Tax=Candidatus Komeilibacteria bacterium RIFCSPLOWO2_02_FULL_48_11 TaxID=1798553 RepID=A0A1G2BV47_9BACT|nr:MAG: hypothetical protein A3H70_03195 [Candidatus Komeilibacteria bacterium RIFCSPLOWO2_02_FULL_48_11]
MSEQIILNQKQKGTFFGFLVIAFIFRLYTSDKKKLDTFKPWYRSEWGWYIVILAIYLLSLIPSLLFIPV